MVTHVCHRFWQLGNGNSQALEKKQQLNNTPVEHSENRPMGSDKVADKDDLLNRLFDQIYDELYSMAQDQRARWRGMDTLNTTALLHETYLKLKRHNPDQIESRRHFLGLASKAMRHVLINYAEKRLALKRGGGSQTLPVDEAGLIADDSAAEELINLHQALEKLEQMNTRQGKVVECRFFGGMSVSDTAFSLNISEATVKRDWQAACDWLYAELADVQTNRGKES